VRVLGRRTLPKRFRAINDGQRLDFIFTSLISRGSYPRPAGHCHRVADRQVIAEEFGEGLASSLALTSTSTFRETFAHSNFSYFLVKSVQ
jgi:hypothetical protein